MENLIAKSYKLFIGGKWIDGRENRTFASHCPANGELLASCAEAGREDIDIAVDTAHKAWLEWKSLSAEQRAGKLYQLASLIEDNGYRLAMIETIDSGKPIRETLHSDIPATVDHFRYFAGVLRADEGKSVMIDTSTLSITLNEPLGVVAQIVPWNYPLLMAAWKIAPALAAGNTVVIKPSVNTPLSLLELGILSQEILPPGVLNIVTGPGETTGNYLLKHTGVKKIAFTGSTETGHIAAKEAASKLIPTTLELGGKSANIFFPDCPWQKSITGAVSAILTSQGQDCSAGSRAFVHEDIYDKFIAELIENFRNTKVGLPWEENTEMGPQISEKHLERILGYISTGKQEGAKIACGGSRIMNNGLDKGYFMEPTIFVDVENGMRIAQEEIFGPVLCIIKFRNEDEVTRMANDSKYGLAGAIWTRDINRALRIANSIEAGRIWINTYGESPSHTPFGGYKKSGYGREGHKITLEHYRRKKNILINLTEST